jgi:hypothetical protein
LNAVESLARGNWRHTVFIVFKLEIDLVCVDVSHCRRGLVLDDRLLLGLVVQIEIDLILILRHYRLWRSGLHRCSPR